MVVLVVDGSSMVNLNIGTAKEYIDRQMNVQSLEVMKSYCFEVVVQLRVL